MRVSIISSKDTLSNFVFTLSFNVTFGPPSRVYCRYEDTTILNNNRAHSKLSREVIRSWYISSAQPDKTRVTVKVYQNKIRDVGLYACQVFVEGHENIVSGSYNHDTKGNGTSTVTVTGECATQSYDYSSPHIPSPPPYFSCRHPHWCCYQQDWLHLCPGLLDCPITTTSWL